ncbi:iron-containing alcohol dehydrogenase [Claveliimonas bilis]|uniref:Alcohol dehydrogenase n=1 Tax=Claveliimonas bilis TaxID=3028070 RepID=A0ABN6YSD1_9FIRM|nr:iron-containing alcohol dehydrogenase [Claveliimonas bilis]BDZ75928.1 alcohol dehydrogenase [Claveliimonas bilis]BDZ80067.1 alcohol dehydrogenase [Claveliimonas bilis]
MGYQIKIPACIYGGEGCIENINNIIEKENAKKLIVYTDKGIRKAGLLDIFTRVVDEIEAEYKVIDDLTAEPAYQDAERVIREAEDYSADLIIGIGGGSVMDAAKLCSVLKGADYTIRDLLKDPTRARKQVKTVMIPTTCGTGSEATCNAIVAIPEEESKQGIVNDSMIPDYVILDSQMIRKLPKSIVAATGVDALAHVVECYTSKKATPFSDTYAAAGARLIFHNIREAYSNPDNMEAKNSMLLGAFYGGVAITGSGTTAVHALSYPLGGKYHIAHGVSNAILFAHVMEYNKEACKDRLAQLCDAVFPEQNSKNVDEKADYIIGQIADIVKVTDIPTDLNQFGVKMEDLDFLVDAGSKQTRLLVNNMRELSLEDIRTIYKRVLK